MSARCFCASSTTSWARAPEAAMATTIHDNRSCSFGMASSVTAHEPARQAVVEPRKRLQNARRRITREIVMTELSALWLPILLGAVICFIASSIIHMAPLWHKNEYPQVPDE